jgi:hypothetical protein
VSRYLTSAGKSPRSISSGRAPDAGGIDRSFSSLLHVHENEDSRLTTLTDESSFVQGDVVHASEEHAYAYSIGDGSALDSEIVLEHAQASVNTAAASAIDTSTAAAAISQLEFDMPS